MAYPYDSPRSYSPPTFRSISTRPPTHGSAASTPFSAPASDRISTLLEQLATTKSILEQECSGNDKYAHLALALMEEKLGGLATACSMIRSASARGSRETARPDGVRRDSKPSLPRISTSDEALQDAVKAQLPIVQPDPRPAPPPPASRPGSVLGHKKEQKVHSSRSRPDYTSDSVSSRHDKYTSSRRPRSPSRLPSPTSPPPPQPSYPALPKSRATSRHSSPVRESTLKLDSSTSSSRRRDTSATPPAPAPIIEERRKSVASRNSQRSRRDVPSSDSDSSSYAEAKVTRARSRARSVGARTSATTGGRKSRAGDEARRLIPEPSAPPPEPEPVVLMGAKVFRAIAETLLSAGDGGLSTVAELARVSKEANEAVRPALYSHVELTSLDAAKALDRTLGNNPSLASMVRKIRINPLDSGSNTVPSLLPTIQTLLSHCPNLSDLSEDLTASDWDVTTLSSDYLLPLSPSSPPHLSNLLSSRCWWELSALVSVLTLQQSSLTSLTLLGAAMDRDWTGATLLAQPAMSPPSRITSLEIAQIMHEDTLAVILRSTPALQSLRIGFQVLGPTDDDTPRKSIPLALAHVGSSLTHLALRAPTKESSEPTAGLLDECVAVLQNLTILEFEETCTLSGTGDRTIKVPLASKDFLLALPPKLKVLRGQGIISFGSSKLLDVLEEAEKIPVLEELDLVWAAAGGEGASGGEVWKERHRSRIEEGCAELGIRCRVEKGEEGLMFQRQ